MKTEISLYASGPAWKIRRSKTVSVLTTGIGKPFGYRYRRVRTVRRGVISLSLANNLDYDNDLFKLLSGCTAMVDKTSVSLLERVRKLDDQESWSRFVRLYTPLLYVWARRLRLAPDEAEELVQDVFVTLVDKLPEFIYDPGRRFRGWLWTVTINKLRERRRKPTSPNADSGEIGQLAITDPVDEFTESEYRRYVTERALQLMETDFEPTSWRAFWEHVTNGRTAGDVAAELGMSVGSVYAAKTRILARLRIELQGLLD